MTKKNQQNPLNQPLTQGELSAIFTRFLQRDVYTEDDARGFAKRLGSNPYVSIPFLIDILKNGTFAEQGVASYLLPVIGGKEIKQSLWQIVRDNESASRSKAMAISLLTDMGQQVDENVLFDQIGGFEKYSREIIEVLLTEVWVDESILESFVHKMEKMPPAERTEMIRELGQVGDVRILRVLLPLLYAKGKDTVMAVIDALETLGSSESVPALTEVSQMSPRLEIRRRARAVYNKLAMAAISPTGQRQARWNLPPQELPLFKAMICTIDGNGAQSIFVGRKHPNGKLKVVNILFNDHQGIKDCFGADMFTIAEWNSIVSKIEKRGMSWVDIGLPLCRNLLSEARAINVRVHRKLPVELIIWGNLLHDDPEVVRLWKDEENEVGVFNEHILEPKFILRTDEILRLPEFSSWSFDLADIDPLAMIAFEEVQRGDSSKAQKEETVHFIAANALKALLKPRLRVLLEGRLRRQAWLLSKLGREQHGRLSLTAANALRRESGIPLEDQPFLIGMVVRSLFISYLFGNRKDPLLS